MLNIIDMFVGLHNIRYVHGDIKPNNILGNRQTREFKMVGFRYTNKVGKNFLGGAGPYLAPERRLNDSKPFELTYKEDIYSLAMTLLRLEGFPNTEGDFIPDICFENDNTLSECRNRFEKLIEHGFHKDRKLDSLIPIFKKALSFNPADRHETPEEFSVDILEAFSKLEGAKGMIEEALNKALKDFPNGKPSDFWKCKVLTVKFPANFFVRIFTNNNIKNVKFQKLCEAKKNTVVAANKNTKLQI